MFNFQRKFQPIRNRVVAFEKRQINFGHVKNFYKEMIDAKNTDENQEILARNIFVDEQHVTETKKIEKDG